MPADLIVYALVAAGLVFWLRSILGTRHGDEQERPNPYVQPEKSADHAAEHPYLADEKPVMPEDSIMALAANKTGNTSVENKTAENGLLEIFVPAALNRGKMSKRQSVSFRLLPADLKEEIESAKESYEVLRVLLDYISGLTDSNAMGLYRKLMGISLPGMR